MNELIRGLVPSRESLEKKVVVDLRIFVESAQAMLSNEVGGLLFFYDRDNFSKVEFLVRNAIKKLKTLPTNNESEKKLKQQANDKLKALLALVRGGTYSRKDLSEAIGEITSLF